MAKKKKVKTPMEPQTVEGIDLSKTVRCLSFDPGTKNFACSVLEARMVDGEFKFKIVGTVMLTDCISEPKAYIRKQARAYEKQFKKIQRKYGPFHLCTAERFQARGYGGHTIESINMMLGIMALTFKGEDFRTVTAAIWKNAFNRTMDLKGLYQERKLYDDAKTDHEFDATMIGVHRLQSLFGLKPFSMFEEEDGIMLLEKYLRAPVLKL